MTTDRPAGESLRLLHWNIHSWIDPATQTSNVEAVIGLLREHEPDAVSLVEVDETWGEPSRLQHVASQCGYAAIFTPCFEYGAEQPEGGFGNAILTRLPILGVETRQLTWPTTVYQGREPSEVRAVLLATLRLDTGVSVVVGSTHWPADNQAARLAAAERLTGITGQLGVPWLICGDFNMGAETWLPGNREFVLAPTPPARTFPTQAPTKSIDYMVAAPGVLIEAAALSVAGSDHLAVLAGITIATY